MSFMQSYGYVVLILLIAILYIYFLEFNKKTIKSSIEESFSNKSDYDPQFAPSKYYGSCNLTKDRLLLADKKLEYELPFNGHNSGYIDLGLPPRVKINSYPTLNFHSPNGPKPEDYDCC